MSPEQDPQAPAEPAAANPATKRLRYEIEWHYTPIDFFPNAAHEHVLDCDLTIDGGTVLARIPAELFEASPNLQRQIDRRIEGRFEAQQFETAKTYELGSSSLTEYQHAGGRIVNVSVFDSCKVTVTAEAQLLDSAGNILFDTVAERARLKAEQEKTNLQLDTQLKSAIQKYYEKDVQPHAPLVAFLLARYRAACNDLEDELGCLYELREALSKHFAGERPTRQTLGVTKSEWSGFGKLANDEPIQQSRHRGKFPGELRAATEEELVEARLFAKKLLLNFLQHLSQPVTALS